MRFRSTGLGKTEMRGNVHDFIKKGDLFVLQVKTIQPPGWTIRAGLTYQDMGKLISLALRPKMLWCLLSGWCRKQGMPNDF